MAEAADPPPTRELRRRRRLPDRRAVVGGFLVALAGLVGAGAHLRADRPPTTRYVVATRALVAGDRLAATDVTTAAMDLPDDQAARAFTAADDVLGAVALGPLAPGELVQAAALRPDGTSTGDDPAATTELAIDVEADRAIGGVLVPGDRVDALATYGTGEAAHTLVVARAALVRAVSTGDTGLGATGGTALTLALDPDDVLATAHAARAGAITLVRPVDGRRAATDDDRYEPSRAGPAPDPSAPPPEPDAAGTTTAEDER